MITHALRLLALVLLVAPAIAADIPGLAIWTSAELTRRDGALSTRVGADHSARETLADYVDHRFRLLYPDADGFEQLPAPKLGILLCQTLPAASFGSLDDTGHGPWS